MKPRYRSLLVALAVSLSGPTTQLIGVEAKFDVIKFNDLASGLSVQLQWSWHAIGIDPADNVYVVFGGPDGDSADCALFQFRSRSGERRLIGTLSEAAKKAGTWREGERIEKGHTHLPWLNGKIYIGTMGFHDASSASPRQMEIAAKSHGAHLMVYDPSTDRIKDLSGNQPDDVFFPQRGFMCLSPMPAEGFIAAFTVPHGDLLVYDPKTAQPHVVVPGVPEEFGRHVTREIIPTPNGKIYYMYSPDSWGKGRAHMYYYDLNARRRSGPIDIDPAYWNGSVRTRDGKAIYITTDRGDIYQLHPETDSVERIGNLIPEADRRAVEDGDRLYQAPHFLGMALSADEKFLYSIPLRKHILKKEAGLREEGEKQARGPQVPFGLFRFDLATRTAHRVADVPASVGNGYISGTNIRDSQGNFYFAHHGGGYLGLVKVTPPSSTEQ